jgi:glycosyltransferase, family 1
MKIPHILFIGPLPPPYSGPEISMQLFLESEILQKNCRLLFLRTNFRKDNVHKGKIDAAGIWFTLRYFLRLLRLLLFHRPDLVYYPITPTQVGWIGRDAPTLLLCRLFGAGAVIHERGSHFKLNYGKFSNWARFLVKQAFKGVYAGIVQADYLHEEFSDFLPPERIYTLYQAIDTEKYRPEPQTHTNMNLLFVGHLTKAKGYCDLLRAMPEVWQRFPNVHLYCAGNIRRGERGVFFNQYDGSPLTYEDPEIAEREFLEKTVPGDRYVNLGIITGKHKMEIFQNADIFVSPSYSEGFSRALLEAMSLGKAIVYTPVGAHEEIMKNGRNGLRVLPGDWHALAAALIHLLVDPEARRTMGRVNRDDAVARFDIAGISEQLLRIFQESMDRERGAR